MSTISTTIAADIDRLHELARTSAAVAVGHAREAGALLLQVKASIPHGEWLPWLAANVKVSARQAQRYIAVAEGRTPPLRELAEPVTEGHPCQAVTGDGASPPSHATSRHVTRESRGANALATGQQHGSHTVVTADKNDSVSHLMAGPMPCAPDWLPRPVYMPKDSHIGLCIGKNSTFVVEPSAPDPGYFFITRLFEDAGETKYDCTARPVRADWIEFTLDFYGLPNPATREWSYRPSNGVNIALESMLSPESIAARKKPETIAQAIARMRRANAGAPA